MVLPKALINLKINNVTRPGYYRKYVITILAFIGFLMLLGSLVYLFLVKARNDRESYFVSACQENIFNYLLRDFELIFNPSSEITSKNLAKNFVINKKKIGNNFILTGTLLQVAKGDTTLTVDIMPFTSLINNVLEKDFYYQINLNDNILATNSQDIEFNSVKNFKIYQNILLTIKLLTKEDSKTFIKSYEYFSDQIKYLLLALVGCFIFFAPIIIYIIKKQDEKSKLINQLHSLNEALEFNLNYIKNCYSEDNHSTFPISLSPVDKNESFDINEFIKNINTCTLGYIALYQYKFELIIESSVDSLPIQCGKHTIEQILISLLHNMLYFMRGGTHVKKLKIFFSNERIIFTYDSFLANESHMANWSKDIFSHTGNLYILDTTKIFELIKHCNFSYEILPKQGENQVIINLKSFKEEGTIVQFTKNKKG